MQGNTCKRRLATATPMRADRYEHAVLSTLFQLRLAERGAAFYLFRDRLLRLFRLACGSLLTFGHVFPFLGCVDA